MFPIFDVSIIVLYYFTKFDFELIKFQSNLSIPIAR